MILKNIKKVMKNLLIQIGFSLASFIKKILERKACIIRGKLIFATKSLELYIYDEQKETLHKVKIPEREKHSKDGDIIEWKGSVYYMLSYYNNGDLHNSFTRVGSSENGIYKLNVDNETMEKYQMRLGKLC